MPSRNTAAPLSAADIEQFVNQGFVKLEHAFPRALADEARAILWRDIGAEPDAPSTWTRPVVRLGHYADPPFRTAASTPALCAAFDQLVGEGRWRPIPAMGTFPVRFPSPDDPGDTGWHVDVGFGGDPADFMSWRANISARGRALLLLFLFSDVGEDDAPTRLRIGSHLDMARALAPAGEMGLSLREMVECGFGGSQNRPEALATGEAGTVFLCHPFLVHCAQRHRGTRPRFLAQPTLEPCSPLGAASADAADTPVEQAIRLAPNT